MDDLPPRVKDVEDRQHFRDLLARSSIGDDEVREVIEQHRRERQALPDRWVSLRRVDFIDLMGIYRERREVHNEDHDTALEHVLSEVEYEANQEDLDEQSHRANTP